MNLLWGRAREDTDFFAETVLREKNATVKMVV